PLHGNVDTRLRRLDAGEADALVLAAAGLDRLDLGGRIVTRIDGESMPPAPAQGALAVQTRRDGSEVLDVLGRVDDGAGRVPGAGRRGRRAGRRRADDAGRRGHAGWPVEVSGSPLARNRRRWVSR